MKRWIIRIGLGLIVLAVAFVAFIWSVLAIPYFSHFRSSLVAELLSEQIGQPLYVEGDVSVVISHNSRVYASGVHLPSENMAGVELATLEKLEFDFDIFALLDGRIGIDNLLVDGLKVELIKNEDGTTSWSDRENTALSWQEIEIPELDVAPVEEEDSGPGLLAFLKTRTVTFADIGLIFENKVSGFEFDFELQEFALTQLDDGLTLGVTSAGKVNGRDFTLTGNYPEDAPFTTKATFSSADITFDGVPFSNDNGGGFDAVFDLKITSIEDLLKGLKLEGEIDGSATIQSKVKNRAGLVSLADLSAAFNLEEGQQISLDGNVEGFGKDDGADLEFNARLYPENIPPPKANDLADLKLTNVSTRIVRENNVIELDKLLISTNAFQQGLDEVGPVSIGRVRRTKEGTLAFQDISLQAGPLDSPFLVARGNIFNILELKEVDLAGDIQAPASLLLSEFGDDIPDAFGGIQADFAIDDDTGALGLTHLNAQAVNTDIWAMNADIKVGDVTTLGETSVDVDLSIKSGAEFLSALDLKPVDTGPLSFGIKVEGDIRDWSGNLKLGAGTSDLTGSMSTGKKNDRPIINATIISETLAIKDFQNMKAGLSELKKIDRPFAQSDSEPDAEIQPLVLPEKSAEAKQVEVPDTSPDVELQPLVIAPEVDDIIDVNEFLRENDIYGQIDLKKISGIKGVTRVSSAFVSEGGKAQLGPLDFNYGGGSFHFTAAMDVIEAPRFVSVSGATSGWDLADIMKTVGVDFDAHGNLNGQFNLAGNLTTIQTFVNSMRGSATIEMSNGRMATSLLELAGLGVFPWLFSKERRQGYTEIACMRAPFKVHAGSVSFGSFVAETQSVQLVAKGSVDWAGDAISVRGEPRPLGRPLARSAWPFTVSGKLSNPQFKLDVGGSRSRRADGADKMPADRKRCRPDMSQLE